MPLTSATAHTITTAHGPLRYYRAGNTGPAVILLHGAMLDTAPLVWGAAIPALQDGYRVFALDWPRHGGSRPWHGPTGQAGLEEAVAELMDHCGLASARLVGLSLGGGIAAGFAARNPDRVERLVLVAPGGMEGRRVAQGSTYLYLRTPGLLRLTTALFAHSPALIRVSLRAALVEGADHPDFAEIVALAEQEMRSKREAGELVMDDWQISSYGWRRMRTDLRPLLRHIACPTLVVRGDRDSVVPLSAVEETARLIPGADLLRVPDAGHLLPRDRPEEFHAALRAFL
ncbi:alpha/beta fold hydrolase [Nocardiopsis ansamitocini]|uniref:Alpha/beta hydrolase n=1 Tax=Nocardiopsis ansamitocini TaxID=1670832 RepID=A0A9W6UKJ6_9ACTN|nr:alpha/beta hydrolase [Nocardiopsis ansamitocini]GLU50044.1 alpha/beta hydrolase [Nocardiopsis ansamitocini]